MNPLAEILKDLWGYIKATKNIYIALFIAFLLLIGAVVIMTEGLCSSSSLVKIHVCSHANNSHYSELFLNNSLK